MEGLLPKPNRDQVRLALLACGVAAACIYVFTDIAAAASYPGFSYTDQAVSELFAIGAPTSAFVVPLFSLSSTLLLLFALGIWLVSEGNRALRLLAVMFVASALLALALWNFFPMHMRGGERTFTDKMHLMLATNPFVLASLVVSGFTFNGRFRSVSIATLLAILLLAGFGLHYATAIDSGQPTLGMGLSERVGQYLYGAWQIALALLLVTRTRASTGQVGAKLSN